MNKIGIIGGVTWISTAVYYKLINQKINQKLGGYNTAEILINSVNFNDVMTFLNKGDWNEIEDLFIKRAIELKKSGAEFLAISSNTIAKVAQNVAKEAQLPLVDIIKTTSEEIKNKKIKRVGFLGTGFTMKSDFYFNQLKDYEIETVIPNSNEIEIISDIITKELANHIITNKSKNMMLQIMERMMKEKRIEGVILGCTEIPLLINQDHTDIPLFDTTEIHTNSIVDFALKNSFKEIID
jgi:aspartate racemase|tara:strand:- start:2471 stop:3187 length:717 start_codon:yes stop_codon:yes gene_type:complete